MSLLADLLSKKNNSDRQDGREIPPTLAMAQSTLPKARSFKDRYVVISVLSIATIAIGLITVLQYDRLIALIDKKPALSQKPPEPPKADANPAPQTQAVQAQAALPQPPVPEKTVAANVVEKPEPPPQQATAKKKVWVKAKRRPSLPAVQTGERTPTAPASEAVSTTKIDTALRDSYLYTARSAELAGDWRSALTSYRKALKVDPDNFKIMSNLAASLNNLGLFDEGVIEAKRALSRRPDYVPAMINAAIAYSSTGNSLEALLLFSKASSADPTNRSLAINLGILQERSGKLEAAKLTYRQLADAGDPQALHGMARIHERNGNRIEAVRAYRQIMALPNAGSTLKREAKEKVMHLEE